MTTVHRIAAPRPPEASAPYRFPLVATIAPGAASIAIWLLTNSPFALVFAALGPVTAIASLVDGRIGSRRSARRELARFLADAETVRAEIDASHDRERAELAEAAPSPRELVGVEWADPQRWTAGPEAVPVALGRGTTMARARVDLPATPVTGRVAEELARLVREAESLRDAMVVVDARLGIGVVGPAPLASSVARALVVGVARALTPRDHWCGWTGEEEWMSRLPHPAGPAPTSRCSAVAFGPRGDPTPIALVAVAESEHALPVGCRTVVHVDGSGARITRHPDRDRRRVLQPELVTRAQAAAWADRLAATAARDGVTGGGLTLPDAVPLTPLLADGAGSLGGLVCTVGVDDSGSVVLDLVRQGPHAVVGGTTGSGKSELLVSWVLGMAASRPPQEVSFLLVDFKGGAAFAPLEALPHVVGTVTDLDGDGASRALESLRSEMRFRERAIVEAGARDIDGATRLGRLVIVVDEFAAMIADQPELHALFADLAARGRALGVHLVLCTQRPTGVVRDSVLANADLRICMRVNNRADSRAVDGTEAAAELPAHARGRGVLALAGSEPRAVQFALASRSDIEAVAARWADAPPARRPWLPPLAAVVLRLVAS